MSKHLRDKVAEKLVEGKGVGEAAEELGVHRNSVSYHKRALTSDMSDSVQEYRAAQIIELSELKAQLVNDGIKPERRIELALQIIDREMDLLGTKAPTKSIRASFSANPEHSREFLLFRESTAGLDEGQMQDVYRFAKSIKRAWTPPAIEADFPQPEQNEAEDAS